MPCIEISLPKVSRDTKVALSAELTAAFCSSTGHPPEILGLRFFEYENESAAIDGKLCDETDARAYLHMLIYCPRLKRSVKQKVGAALSEAFRQATKRPDWNLTIHICEHPYDHIVVGGKLLTDAYEECAQRDFYYPLPKD